MSRDYMDVIPVIRWPAILFGRPNCVMRVIDNVQSLITVRYIGIDTINHMDEYYVVDSNGNVFHLANIHLLRAASALRRAFLHLLNPIVQVEYRTIMAGERMTPSALKNRMLHDIQEHYEYWSDLSNIEELIESIKQANTIQELICLLTGPKLD